MLEAPDESSVLSGRPLTIEDLDEVIKLLQKHHFDKTRYHDLGLSLKSSDNTLKRITKEHKNEVEACFRECLASWLHKRDPKVKIPTIDTLVAALKEIEENAVADGINEERQKLYGLSKESEAYAESATDQKGHYGGATLSSLSDATKPTGEKNNPASKQSNKKKGRSFFSRKKNQPTLLSSDTNVKVTDLLENRLHRNKKRFLFKDTFEQEIVRIQRRGDSICLMIGKKTEETLLYNMAGGTCVGVYLRWSLDHASKKWPGDAEPEHCFTVVDEDDDKTLYLIAEKQDIAENWVKELKRHVHLKKVDRRKGYFGFNDLEELYEVLTEDESTAWNIDLLGASLGFSDETQKMIEKSHSTEKERLRECLSYWLKGGDGDDDTEVEGPKCDELKKALKNMGKEEIAKKIDEKFSQTEMITDTDSVQDSKIERYKEKAWKKFAKGKYYKQAVATAKKAPAANLVFQLIAQKMEQNDVASVLAEISFLSNKRMSSLITVKNQTLEEIVYHKCYVARGRASGYVGFGRNVLPKQQTGYSFENYTRLSLEGCAAMLFFSATTCEPKECFFVIAFHNYVLKLRRPNKTVVMILESFDSIDKLDNNLQQYSKIMNAEEDSIDVPGMNLEKKYDKPLMLAGRGDINALKFPSIEFDVYMSNDNYQSQSIITVSHPQTDTQ